MGVGGGGGGFCVCVCVGGWGGGGGGGGGGGVGGGDPPATGGPTYYKGLVMQCFDVFFVVALNKLLKKQSS